MPTLSIIVPVYNKVNFVDECIKSILNQTFTDFELILINDGSTDGSENKCEYYQEQDERVKVISQTNQGVSQARNAGMSYANGKYIGFVDSDDTIDEDMYELLINNIIAHEADISICGIKKINGKKIEMLYGNNNTLIYNKVDAITALLRKDIQRSVYDKIYRSDIVKKLTFSGSMDEDVFFNFLVLCISDKIVFHDSVKYNYIIRDNSVSMSKFSKKYMQIIDFSEKILDLTKKNIPQLVGEVEYFYFVNSISILNLILLSDKKLYLDNYTSILGNLRKIPIYTNKKIFYSKYLIAYNMLMFSPMAYAKVMKLYCLITDADVIKRI